jgi:hypothetical protein
VSQRDGPKTLTAGETSFLHKPCKICYAIFNQ